ncbi:ABC transporter ATP-binding protein [Phytohabitans rumicis]|uniref:ABC transporter domain-containing protein n=1 Tax=Phytohabitans rumicis TaxID=1076125 RepID=A0A6V8LKE9_9ACTN|nr:ABC transporter ATP-binding protein [Phytohabitans rumicis]GFJ94646.1 hypothetical protein Prum_082880 [Phytohabitans rumicis]
MKETVLTVRELTKAYRGRPVLRGVSLTAAAGEVIGVVGPNGAGKSTLVECVEGLRRPDGGDLDILGHRPAEGPRVYHALFGAQLQDSSLPARLRVGEALELFAAVHARPRDVGETLARMGLESERHRPFGKLSGGQKRRVLLAVALIGRPPLLLLDEPTVGLDPHARLALWRLLRSSADAGAAILFTTHDMAEAEEYSDRLHLLDGGRVAAVGRPADLLRTAGLGSRLRAPRHDGLAAWLERVPGHSGLQVVDGTVYGYGDAAYSRTVMRLLEEARDGLGDLPPAVAKDVLDRLTVGPARMEDFYLMSTGAIYDAHR